MAITPKIAALLTKGGENLSAEKSFSEQGWVELDYAISGTVADVLLTLALDASCLVALLITHDLATADVVVETNDASTPDDTITVNAGTPVLWYLGIDGLGNRTQCPIQTDVTAIYVTRTGVETGTLKIRALYDATP